MQRSPGEALHARVLNDGQIRAVLGGASLTLAKFAPGDRQSIAYQSLGDEVTNFIDAELLAQSEEPQAILLTSVGLNSKTRSLIAWDTTGIRWNYAGCGGEYGYTIIDRVVICGIGSNRLVGLGIADKSFLWELDYEENLVERRIFPAESSAVLSELRQLNNLQRLTFFRLSPKSGKKEYVTSIESSIDDRVSYATVNRDGGVVAVLTRFDGDDRSLRLVVYQNDAIISDAEFKGAPRFSESALHLGKILLLLLDERENYFLVAQDLEANQEIWRTDIGSRNSPRLWISEDAVGLLSTGSTVFLDSLDASDGSKIFSGDLGITAPIIGPERVLGEKLRFPISIDADLSALDVNFKTGAVTNFRPTSVPKPVRWCDWYSRGGRTFCAQSYKNPAGARFRGVAIENYSGRVVFSEEYISPILSGPEQYSGFGQISNRGQRFMIQASNSELSQAAVFGFDKPGFEQLATFPPSSSLEVSDDGDVVGTYFGDCLGGQSSQIAVRVVDKIGRQRWCRDSNTLGLPLDVSRIYDQGFAIGQPNQTGRGFLTRQGTVAWRFNASSANWAFLSGGADRILFRVGVVEGELDPLSGLVLWQYQNPPLRGGARSLVRADRRWFRARSMENALRFVQHDAAGNLDWENQLQSRFGAPAPKAIVEQGTQLLVQVEQRFLGGLMSSVVVVDGENGGLRGRYFSDIKPDENPVSRASLPLIVGSREGGGLVEVAHEFVSGNELEDVLFGYPARSSSQAALQLNGGFDGMDSALGSSLSIRLPVEYQGPPVNAVLYAMRHNAFGIANAICSGGISQCEVRQGREGQTVLLRIGGPGTVELSLDKIGGVDLVESVTYVIATQEVPEETLDDNIVSWAIKSGPFASGFE